VAGPGRLDVSCFAGDRHLHCLCQRHRRTATPAGRRARKRAQVDRAPDMCRWDTCHRLLMELTLSRTRAFFPGCSQVPGPAARSGGRLPRDLDPMPRRGPGSRACGVANAWESGPASRKPKRSPGARERSQERDPASRLQRPAQSPSPVLTRPLRGIIPAGRPSCQSTTPSTTA